MSSNIEIKRICEFCKQEFTARTTKTRFCSHKCASRNHKALTRKGKVEKSNLETALIRNTGLEEIRLREFLNINQAGLLFGISRRTIYRLINQGCVNVGKFGNRSVIRRCDLESFFAVPIVEQTLNPIQAFPGIQKCYHIGQVQEMYGISPAGLYHIIQRHGINKYAIGKFVYVAKSDIDVIFNTVES